jgi:hypothetical protein
MKEKDSFIADSRSSRLSKNYKKIQLAKKYHFREKFYKNLTPPRFSKKIDFLKYKKLIKLKQAILRSPKFKISPKIFTKKVFIKTMHRKGFDYQSCGNMGIYPMKPIHLEISYRLMISIFLFSPQKVSLLSPSIDI